AAASVGGLHAADVVDVPVLPDTGRRVEQPASPELAESQGAASSEAGDAGKETAEGNKGAASAYADATRDWTDCVAGAAAAQGDESTRTTGGFDPRSECGEKPRPGDFGLTVLPDQANEKAREAVGSAPTPATPGKPPVSVPTDHSAPEVTPAPEDPGKAPA